MSIPNFVTAKTDLLELDGKKNGELNALLGFDGAPKYSAGQMKSRTKAQLEDELRGAMTDWAEEHPVVAKRTARASTGGVTGAVQKVSLNFDVAASKKCNLLKAATNNTKSDEQIMAAYNFDTKLQEYCPREKFEKLLVEARAGIRPKAGRKMVQLPLFQD